MKSLKRLSLKNTYVEGKGLPELPSLEDLDLLGAPITDTGAAELVRFPALVRLSLAETDITNEGMGHVTKLPKLQRLDLSGSDVGDAGLEKLKGATALNELILRHCRLTDAGLVHLQALPNLRRLDLLQTRIGDKGMAVLGTLVNLTSLNLDNGEITDAGLQHLAGAQAIDGTQPRQYSCDRQVGCRVARTAAVAKAESVPYVFHGRRAFGIEDSVA